MTGMKTLLTQYLDWLRICGRSPRTIGARSEILARVDGDLDEGLERATADELIGWIYRDGWSEQTKQTYYGAIRSFFVWATDPHDPKLDHDPSSLLPAPKVHRGLPRPITDDQLAQILTTSVEPYRVWAVLAAYAGLRCCEIAQMNREDIDQVSILIKRGKGGKPGVVPTHPAIWEAVRDLPPGPLALDPHGGRANGQWVSIRTALYFRRKLKMPGVALHRLRHWYGTTVYRSTKDIRVTQELLRHSSPTTTAIYTLISDDERRDAIATLVVPTGSFQA